MVRNVTTIKKRNHINKDVDIIIPMERLSLQYNQSNKDVGIDNYLKILEKNINIIQYVFNNMANIILIVGHDSEEIVKLKQVYNIRCIYNTSYATTNSLYSLYLGLCAGTSKNVITISGNLLFNKNAINNIANDKSQILIDTSHKISNDEVGVMYDDNMITKMCYGQKTKWGHITYLTGTELSLMRYISSQKDNNSLFLYEGINKVIAKGGKLKLYEPSYLRLFLINNMVDYVNATKT